ncbi:MAG: PD40 domain-containing protein [Acidobacteria bacterium]|nr:PD40 domain-containing protein [Acidobacteriota bacterium]
MIGSASAPEGTTQSGRLDPRRWDRAGALFDLAVELPPAERRALFEHAAASDPALAAEVETLVAADERAAGFLAEPADPGCELLAAAVLEHDARAAADRVGQRFGAFRLVREIGHGGMGVVYLADRADGQFEQRVAIKLVHAGPHGERLLRGFLRERRILAQLEHPHIARLLDGGLTSDGMPYLVMEYVEGEPITVHCEHQHLPVNERLQLFLAVCEAVEAAHRAHVVHRDLKPSNVMVSRRGEVKLLDFGAAGSLDLEATATRTFALTPLYAAPEQLRGQPATAATDVYALGLLLYELLTGVRAHALPRESPGELMRVVLFAEPARPSEAAARRQAGTAAAAARRRLRGDLDGIVLKALEKDPAHRYPSAAAMAGDVRRHLAGRPVTAGSRGMTYRAVKLVRRWRLEVLAALAVLALAAAAAALWLRSSAAPARPRRFELLSTFGGSHRSPSLSPDGRRVAFVERDARGVPQIWVKDLARGAPVQVTRGDRPAHRPRWSPREGLIFFDVPDHGIWTVPARGGEPRLLLREGYDVNLSRDGSRLVYETEAQIWCAQSDGTGARPLTAERFEISPRTPAFSPDGRWVVFFVSATGISGDLWIAPAAGGGARRLTHDLAQGGDPVWTPDGQWIFYSSERSGAVNLWRVPAGGGTPEVVTEGAGEDAEPDVSRDGRLLVYTSTRNVYSLSWLDPRTGERRDLLERRTPATYPSFSPRGDRVAFFNPRGPQSHLYTVGLHGEDLREITTDPQGFEILPSWSGDGRFLYFYEARLRFFFGRVPATGGPLQLLIPGWRFERQLGAQVDPAGKRVAYTQIQGFRPAATRIRDLGTGRETALAQPLLWPRWSPDGSALAGRAAAGRLLLCPASGAACLTLSQRGHEPRWTRGGSEIYFSRYEGKMSPLVETIGIWSVKPDGTGERHVAELPGVHFIHTFYEASPTGEIVWCEWRPGRQEMWEAQLR